MNTTAAIVLFLGVVYWLFRPRREQDASAKLRRRSPRPFPATSIAHPADACSAAREIDRTRFLAWEAPSLPLAGCNTEECRCHYIYHGDRRSLGPDRRRASLDNRVEPSFDRRRGADRRRANRAPVTPIEVTPETRSLSGLDAS